MINAPDNAPPSLPRVVLKLQDTILNVALDRLHITTQPPSHVAQDMDKAVQFAYQRSNPIISDMQPAKLNYKWSGVVAEVEYPEDPLISKSAPEAATPLFDRLIKIDRKDRELGSFQLQFGIRDDNYYVNYTVTAFEARQIKLSLPSPKQYISIDIKEYPLTECGLKVILDVNNKPGPESRDPGRDLKLIFDKQTKSFANIAKTLNLEGILK
jgi:hypothetical protein